LLGTTVLYGCTPAQEVVATIDGEKISISQLRSRINTYDDRSDPENPAAPAQRTKLATAEATLSQIINERLLLIEARRQEILTDADILSPAKREEALRRVLNRLGKDVAFPSYQEAYNYYEQHQNEFLTKPRYQIEHLVLTSEDQAWKLKVRIEKGELTMADAAREITGIQPTDNIHSRLITGTEMPVEVAAILPGLKNNQLSQPVATPYGYHLIRINKKLPAGIVPFPEIENSIKDTIFAARLQKNYRRWLKQSREQHTIKIYHQHLTAYYS
jgi:parvulin-like peptidyl-prolyl isomerase